MSMSMSERGSGLEMCTEMLGCETGCHFYPLDTNNNTKKSSPPQPQLIRHKTCTATFPPPLTSSGVRVQAQRGGGRLLITAFARRAYIKSERQNGRLRLFLHNDYYRRSSAQSENGGKLSFKCGGDSNNLTITTLPPFCMAFS